MASAPHPLAANIFNEDEDLLDDDDDEISEEESASSAADRPLPASTALVTVAVPGVPILRVDQEHHQQQHQEIVIAKKPPQPDEARKLFQRLWNDEDEIELLQGFLDYTTQRGVTNNSSHHHHHDTTAFYDQIKSKFQLDFNKNQLVEKLRRLKKKYRNIMNKFGSGKDYAFKSPHEQITFEISSKIWGNTATNFNGASAIRAFPGPVEEDDDEPSNPNFIDCLSPNPNGMDVNSKTPRPRKRNRVGAVKVEEKPHHAINTNIHILNNHPSVPVTPMAAPVMGMSMGMGMGTAGSLSSVIEEAVKNCLSPVLKELLNNSVSSNPNSNGLCCGHGFGLTLSPITLGLSGGMGGDKMADNKWRKQQILELEVFSKRLELVQDQINEQLQELRSTGN